MTTIFIKIPTVSREARPRKLTFYCFGSLWEIMRPQCPGLPIIPLSKVSSVSTFSLSGSLRKPATRPSLSPYTSGFYLLTGFHRGPSSRPFTDSMALAPTYLGPRQRHSYLSFSFLIEYPMGPIFPHGTLNCLISSYCLLCFLFFPLLLHCVVCGS